MQGFREHVKNPAPLMIAIFYKLFQYTTLKYKIVVLYRMDHGWMLVATIYNSLIVYFLLGSSTLQPSLSTKMYTRPERCPTKLMMIGAVSRKTERATY